MLLYKQRKSSLIVQNADLLMYIDFGGEKVSILLNYSDVLLFETGLAKITECYILFLITLDIFHSYTP